jgi:hypothetical protein
MDFVILEMEQLYIVEEQVLAYGKQGIGQVTKLIQYITFNLISTAI